MQLFDQLEEKYFFRPVSIQNPGSAYNWKTGVVVNISQTPDRPTMFKVQFDDLTYGESMFFENELEIIH